MMRAEMSGRPFGRPPSAVLRRIGTAIVAGIVLAALGPFGSYMNGGPARRAGYWIAAMLLGLVLYGGAFRLVTAITPAGSRLRWPALIGATLLASVPEAAVTRAGAFRLWPELGRIGLSWPLWFAQTATIGLIATIGAAVILRRAAPQPPGDRAAAPPDRAGAAALGADVLALQMEDHYVRVHRSTGSALILMPLGRAIEGVAVEGLRTHRSWWIARHAVARIEGNARSMRLHLSNGMIAPVARSAFIRLKDAGWISAADGDAGVRDTAPPSPKD